MTKPGITPTPAKNLLSELRDALYDHRYNKMPIVEVEAWIQKIDVELRAESVISSEHEAKEKAESFWVVERFENGKSAGYWDGANSRSFLPDIEKAIQFRRKDDAFWATRGWHWGDTKITEHIYLSVLSSEGEAKGKSYES